MISRSLLALVGALVTLGAGAVSAAANSVQLPPVPSAIPPPSTASLANQPVLGVGSLQPPTPSPSPGPNPATSPEQRAIDAQVQSALARLGLTSGQPHAGTAEQTTHPDADHAGSGETARSASPAPGAPGSGGADQIAPLLGPSQPGLDVSSYQGNVDWSEVHSTGAQFAYVKATEGTYYKSPAFAQQYNGAADAGLIRGAYHFAIPNNSSGAAQADFFVANGGTWSPNTRTLPGALDIEYNPYGPECYGLSQPQMVGWIADFVHEYHALTGRSPTIYSTTDWWTTCTGNYGGFGADPLWIANYNGSPDPLPNGWSNYTFWQYADQGVYPGDQDLFNGTYAQLVGLATNGP